MSEPAECSLATDFGMQMADKFRQKEGHELPQDRIQFAGMLAIAFMLGRESIAGKPVDRTGDSGDK
jgi:hypothetical protein